MKSFLLLFSLFAFNIFSQVSNNAETFFSDIIVSSISSYGDDVWVATYGSGIFHYSKKNNKWQNFSTKNKNIEQDFFYCIAVSKDFVWAGSSEGFYTYEIKSNQWRKRKFALGGELGNWIRALEYDAKQNMLYIGRFMNLTRLDVARNRFTDYNKTIGGDTKTNNFKSIRMDGDSLIWFGTEAGAHVYNKKLKIEEERAWRFVNNKGRGFNGDGDAVSVSDFYFENKNIWFGVDEFITPQKPSFNIGGIYKHNRVNEWLRFDMRKGMSANGIYCLERVGNYIWVSVYSFDITNKKEIGKGLVLVNRIDNSITKVELIEYDIYSNTIISMHNDGEYMWLGTDMGLHRFYLKNPLAEWSGKKSTSNKK